MAHRGDFVCDWYIVHPTGNQCQTHHLQSIAALFLNGPSQYPVSARCILSSLSCDLVDVFTSLLKDPSCSSDSNALGLVDSWMHRR